MRNLVLCVTILIVISATNTFPLDALINISISVMNWHHSKCIYILHSEHSGITEELTKSLYKRNIYVGTVTLKNILHTLKRESCLPLYVLGPSSNTLQHYMKQVGTVTALSGTKWLFFVNTVVSLEELFTGIFIPFDCEFFVAQNIDLSVLITEVYHIDSILPLQTYTVANWSSDGGMILSSGSVYKRRNNLRGTTIKVVVKAQAPYLTIAGERGNKNFEVGGFFKEMWGTLERQLNFRTEFYKNDLYGLENENGTWNGMIGMILTKHVDVGISIFSFSHSRFKVVNYLKPIWNSNKVMVRIRQPDMEESSFTLILSHFTAELWGAVVVTMLVLTCLLSGTWYAGLKYEPQDKQDPSIYTLYESWLYIFGIFCQQGHDVTPRSWSCRLVYITSYFIAIIVLAAYSGIFTSFITVQRNSLPFTDFKGLLKDGTYKLGVLSNSADETYFQETQDPLMSLVYKKLLSPNKQNHPRSALEGLKQICERYKYGYIISDRVFQTFKKRVSCKIVDVNKAYYSDTVSIIVSKTWPYRRLFDHYVQQMRYTGILNRNERLISGLKLTEIENPPSGATFQTVKAFFIILTLGALISVFILFVEILLKKVIYRQLPYYE